MSDYALAQGGSLKLKGVKDGGIVKKYAFSCPRYAPVHRWYRKKKTKSKSKETERAVERKNLEKLLQQDQEDNQITSGGSGNPPAGGSSADRKTDAEKRFEEIRRKRVSF